MSQIDADSVAAHREFGDFIRRRREQASLTLVQLAERMGIDAATLEQIERNGFEPTYVRLLQVLSCTDFDDYDGLLA